MVDWADKGVDLAVTAAAVVFALYFDRRAVRRSEDRQKVAEKARLRAMRKDLVGSIQENLAILGRIQPDGPRSEGRWLPVAYLHFSVWKAHQGEYVRTETNAQERVAVTTFFERLETLQRMAGLGRLELERLRNVIQDPNRRSEPPPSPTLVAIEDALSRTFREAVTMREALVPRLEMEPSRWRRKRIEPKSG